MKRPNLTPSLASELRVLAILCSRLLTDEMDTAHPDPRGEAAKAVVQAETYLMLAATLLELHESTS